MHVRDGAGALAERLSRLIGPRASVARAVLEQHGRSESYHPALAPDIVVFPETTAEVAEIVRLCAAAGMPIVPYGAGTSLEGNAAAAAGGACIDFARMNKVLAVHGSDMDVVVQPGITRKQLNAQLRDTGLFFPIDPGADASIGGMTSTRASGTMAVRYGTMKDNVLALEVVLADGRVIRTAKRARKSAAGYDLTRLFVGAEGTLGVITEITLKLHPVPPAISAATCSFPGLHAAVDAAIALIQSAIPAARIELVDEVMMRGINAYSGLGYAEAPTLFLEFHGTEAAVAEQAQIAEAITTEHGGHGFAWAKAAEDRSRLWHARDNTLYAGLGLRPGARAVITDVCVPISRLAECLTETRRDADSHGFVAPIVGHVGDGNFHMLILIDPDDASELAGAKALQGRMVARAVAMDGTCTGEHGVGLGKIDYLTDELGEAVAVMRSVKAALDPSGLLNPGKIFAGADP
ncbi:putative D-lactate dehydrogenase, mitochondrial precursor (Lactate dehydrogenase D) (DLD) [Bradyrhizobium sp. ORS 375]|uniref:FAD-linked oxidase C-terminal domain-containing protein n=1 Tax=Bradyrhizobium sp. (strain ORS 375) TaxID=566679 RepID=UPI0002408B82|nr:FAD-linked oxidase C-terminal domain-containing protein [Bradyrhizobium sp. ORS 375]CCD96142.1 putative D-lactate dehydrogenase, mitochondrial precursor (Lactate dehydrogenase D) (DLD) [Bradyrhizobium sp. ORS 375]